VLCLTAAPGGSWGNAVADPRLTILVARREGFCRTATLHEVFVRVETMSVSPRGRVVLLTGAAGGIGQVMTQALLRVGHCVAAVDRDASGLERLASAWTTRADGRFHAIFADLGSEAGCEHSVEATRVQFGTVDAVINNAGIGMSSIRPDAETRHPTIEELTPEWWNRFLAIFVQAPMVITRAAIASMKQGGWGRIINNTTSYRTMLRVLPYGAVKAALEAMSAVWAKELEGSGITVNVLVPGGPTDTPFIANEVGWPRSAMLRPQIMGPPVCWLMSEESNGVTGTRITAARWDPDLPTTQAAQRASRAIGWPELSGDAVWLSSQPP
jgi:NAD(P)-dependent dehydrogenase (short-subunit alcohol dehydrogenase family)